MRERARGCLLGLALGDALGAPAENLTPEQIAQRWGRLDAFVADDPAGTDDTEFAAFAAGLLLEHGAALTAADAAAAWRRDIVGQREAFRGGGFSTLEAIVNLERGLQPPHSGRHHHAWSDGLAMRAAVHGVFAAGDPVLAARLAVAEGSVDHDGEGLHGGAAVAAGVACAMVGGDARAVAAAALAAIPPDSWTARALTAAVAAGVAADGPQDLTARLHAALVTHRYPWTDLAPEAVGLAFGAFVAADGAFVDSVVGAVNLGRDADTIAAIAGALAGAVGGEDALPADWRARLGPLRGSCLRVVAGQDMTEIADALAEASWRR
ncbi:ADP-ribosylglycohydrolase [Baekduia alba]|uniref:ADP-ribosylglycohydrolase family protein n=1 Tax=Baekduia alba TaxID=2997333 RepID=UPI0023418DBC|nr:ADP-ribosylglycohydrolase family protein [Baekduia alba]WCB93417.1 ADP-ribosylglycohydrolase [Baekduia alba]